MKFVNGFKALVSSREISESGVLAQEIEAVESGDARVEVKYEDESGTIIDPKSFTLIYGSTKLQGSVSGKPDSETDPEIVIKTLDGRKILE